MEKTPRRKEPLDPLEIEICNALIDRAEKQSRAVNLIQPKIVIDFEDPKDPWFKEHARTAQTIDQTELLELMRRLGSRNIIRYTRTADRSKVAQIILNVEALPKLYSHLRYERIHEKTVGDEEYLRRFLKGFGGSNLITDYLEHLYTEVRHGAKLDSMVGSREELEDDIKVLDALIHHDGPRRTTKNFGLTFFRRHRCPGQTKGKTHQNIQGA